MAVSSYAPPAAHGGRKRQRQESEGMIPTSRPESLGSRPGSGESYPIGIMSVVSFSHAGHQPCDIRL